MKILVIGSGGREHALCWKLAQNPGNEIFATPGNPGMAQLASCYPASDPLKLAESLDVNLTVVGPEAPLAKGIVDRFRARGLAIFGPAQAAAKLESSKTFAKEFMERWRIPTARFVSVGSADQAREALRDFPLPVVLKADGLAAGKGVIIAHTREEAEHGIAQLMAGGGTLVIEEFLAGEEVSFIVLSDGTRVVPLEATQDHKAVFDGDQGPNTGGMGAYCDGRILTAEQGRVVLDTVIHPVIEGMRAEGTPFTGFLYAGLMMTADGPRVLEFNARLGDPETQPLMHRMRGDFTAALHGAANGKLPETAFEWKADPSVCVVLASGGYPGVPRKGDRIKGCEQVNHGVVFHAGTALDLYGLVTTGGRVLGITCSGPDLVSAIRATYDEVAKVRFEGMHYRTDIGRKGLARWA
ncbi:MAG TPA: phosphoribosylamine--glycine ligase [Bryobacteraceae bacterium]|nr:phosphoribosylamine--glycine ligase [Bryobacteraceae bacterium]